MSSLLKIAASLTLLASLTACTVVQGSGAFVDPFHLKVDLANAKEKGATQTIRQGD